MTRNDCPRKDKHTPCPTGYLEWHIWAEKMSRNHTPVRCDVCGLLSIWVDKTQVAGAIIFLDIDGVLITRKSPNMTTPDHSCVQRLNYLLAKTGANIVLSSTWRKAGYDKMKNVLGEWGVIVDLFDVTPDLSQRRESGVIGGVERGDEIAKWLSLHPNIDQFVILDDERDMGDLLPHLVQTDFEEGLTLWHVELAMDQLLRVEGGGS